MRLPKGTFPVRAFVVVFRDDDPINEKNLMANLDVLQKNLVAFCNSIAKKPYNESGKETFRFAVTFAKGNNITHKSLRPLGTLISRESSELVMERMCGSMPLDEILNNDEIVKDFFGSVEKMKALYGESEDTNETDQAKDGDQDFEAIP